MGEAATYDKLPEAEQQALPNEAHLVAALEWAEPGPEAEETNYWLHRGGR
ncbi:hypothetical protein GCM10009589_27730 [Arthrobacter pascens]|nr:hypothetical protein [Arthrobacter pascens]